MIRPLTLEADRAAIFALFDTSADYVWMEREEMPLPYLVDEYFSDAPPGLDPADSHRVGLFEGETLLALAEMAFGYPAPDSAYLGLMMVRPEARGTGTGQRLLRHLEGVARGRGLRQMALGVLAVNPRARAFWEREGFMATDLQGPVTIGQKTQTAYRLAKPL